MPSAAAVSPNAHISVFELIEKLGTYTEATTVANANNDNFTKNQQLILDNKAIFCPNIFTPSTGAVAANPPITAVAPLS